MANMTSLKSLVFHAAGWLQRKTLPAAEASNVIAVVEIAAAILDVAEQLVARVENDPRYKQLIANEARGNIAFCPRCGQKPWRDYRCEEVFAGLFKRFPNAHRSDLYLAIEVAVHGRLK